MEYLNRFSNRLAGCGYAQPVFKILFIGDPCAGKTSLVQRYAYDTFSPHQQATIGVDFASKTIGWSINTTVCLQLWDVAGQERFATMTRPFYNRADAAFIVFDASRAAAFDNVATWKADLNNKVRLACGAPIPCVLLANKCDLEKEGMVTDREFMNAFADRHGFNGWIETSAKEDIGIERAVEFLICKLMDVTERRVDGPGEREFMAGDREGDCVCEKVVQPNGAITHVGPKEHLGHTLPRGEEVEQWCPCW